MKYKLSENATFLWDTLLEVAGLRNDLKIYANKDIGEEQKYIINDLISPLLDAIQVKIWALIEETD